MGDAEQLLGQLKKGMSEQFPRVAELQAAGVANGSTKLTDLAASGNRVLDGPGLDRLLSHVPNGDRAGLFTDKIIDEVMSGIGKRTKIQEASFSTIQCPLVYRASPVILECRHRQRWHVQTGTHHC